MAVYRHLLEIPLTAKVLPPKNEKPPTAKNVTAVLHYRRKITAIFWFYRFRKKVPPTLDTAEKYRQLSIPPKEYRQLSIPPKRYRRRWIPPKRYHRYLIPPKRYRVHWIPPKKYRLFFSLSFFVLCSFWFFGFLFGRTSLWTCGQTPPHLPIHLPPHLPTPRSAWSS